MTKLFLSSLIALAVMTTSLVSAPQSSFTLDQVFAKIDAVSKTFKSTEANIERTKVTVIVDDKDVSTGKFYYARQGKDPRVKLELTKPAVQHLLINAGKLQLYSPNLKQVQEADITKRKDAVEMFLALGFGQSSAELKQNFEVALAPDEVVDGQKRTVLDLRPKATSSGFQSVRLWLDQKAWHAVQIKTVEKTNDYLIVKFTNVKMNSKIPDSRFKLNLPKDVKVIRM
jgi:outer membrane lipoprotein-sorting protein